MDDYITAGHGNYACIQSIPAGVHCNISAAYIKRPGAFIIATSVIRIYAVIVCNNVRISTGNCYGVTFKPFLALRYIDITCIDCELQIGMHCVISDCYGIVAPINCDSVI